MPTGSAGRRYAQAIFALASEQNKLEQWSQDLATIVSVLGEEEVQNFLQNPKTSRDSKLQFVTNMLSGRISPEAFNLARLLVQRERQSYIAGINEEFVRLWNQQRGIVEAEVTVAENLSPDEEKAIQQKLSAITGKTVTIRTRVDPGILGGLVARVGDTLIDGSVRTRLQNLKKQLAQ